jgi:outer membrane protein assembly factor BamE (lipoprotein component of BamABCDE complex)
MHKFKWLSALALTVITSSCGKSLPELEGIDLKTWKDDKNGCTNIRSNQIESLRTQKNKILALDEMQVVKLLGKPDRNELYKRNQKFYLYYLQPSKECSVVKPLIEPLKLTIRFNAMGLAKEIAVE